MDVFPPFNFLSFLLSPLPFRSLQDAAEIVSHLVISPDGNIPGSSSTGFSLHALVNWQMLCDGGYRDNEQSLTKINIWMFIHK